MGLISEDVKPINTCFGIDLYQIDNNIVEEKEYAKSKI